jgi:hypothetical protein
LAPPVKAHALDRAFLRADEQSFLKIPEMKAIIFAIRTIVTPWALEPANTRNIISRAVQALNPDWLEYKALETGEPD